MPNRHIASEAAKPSDIRKGEKAIVKLIEIYEKQLIKKNLESPSRSAL